MKLNRLLIILAISVVAGGCAKKNNDTDEQIVTAGAKLNGTWVQKSSSIFY